MSCNFYNCMVLHYFIEISRPRESSPTLNFNLSLLGKISFFPVGLIWDKSRPEGWTGQWTRDGDIFFHWQQVEMVVLWSTLNYPVKNLAAAVILSSQPQCYWLTTNLVVAQPGPTSLPILYLSSQQLPALFRPTTARTTPFCRTRTSVVNFPFLPTTTTTTCPNQIASTTTTTTHGC